jgi:hypothetical protein
MVSFCLSLISVATLWIFSSQSYRLSSVSVSRKSNAHTSFLRSSQSDEVSYDFENDYFDMVNLKKPLSSMTALPAWSQISISSTKDTALRRFDAMSMEKNRKVQRKERPLFDVTPKSPEDAEFLKAMKDVLEMRRGIFILLFFYPFF